MIDLGLFPVKADLHNHWRTSSRILEGDFDKVAELAYLRLGFGAIVGITNFGDFRYEHFVNLKGYDREFLGDDFGAVYVPKNGVCFVKGQEIPTKEGHLLVLGMGQRVYIKEKMSLEDTIKAAKDNNGIIIADHPFYKDGIGDSLICKPELISQLDGIEIYNGEAALGLPGLLPKNANARARQFYEVCSLIFPNLGAISSSDGHSFYEIGRNYTELSEINLNDFIPSLKHAIQRANLETPSQVRSSKLGALQHGLNMVFLNSIAYPLGFGKYFLGTDRPKN